MNINPDLCKTNSLSRNSIFTLTWPFLLTLSLTECSCSLMLHAYSRKTANTNFKVCSLIRPGFTTKYGTTKCSINQFRYNRNCINTIHSAKPYITQHKQGTILVFHNINKNRKTCFFKLEHCQLNTKIVCSATQNI